MPVKVPGLVGLVSPPHPTATPTGCGMAAGVATRSEAALPGASQSHSLVRARRLGLSPVPWGLGGFLPPPLGRGAALGIPVRGLTADSPALPQNARCGSQELPCFVSFLCF